MKYEFSWDGLQMELTFQTPKGYNIKVSERFDFHDRNLDELEIFVNEQSYLYWPCDDIRKLDITETFVTNLANVIDDHFIDDDGEEYFMNDEGLPDLHEIKRDGTCGKMSSEKSEQKTKEKQARIERRRYINEMLVANQTRHSKSPVSSVTAEDVLKIIRINNANSRREDLFVEQPVIPDTLIEYKTVRQMEITGGPYHSFGEGFGIDPWKALYCDKRNSSKSIYLVLLCASSGFRGDSNLQGRSQTSNSYSSLLDFALLVVQFLNKIVDRSLWNRVVFCIIPVRELELITNAPY